MNRGITLMEVLIAMFVLLIGLLGVFSMLPVAKSYMSDSAKYDAVSAVGQRALRELEVRRELMTPTNWYCPDGLGSCTWVCPRENNGGVPGLPSYNFLFSTQTANTGDIPAAPFILDPLGCAYPDNLAANNGNFQVGPTDFPPVAFSLDQVGGSQAAPGLSRVTIPRDNQTYPAIGPTAIGFYKDGAFVPPANPAFAGNPAVQPPLFFRAAPMSFGQAAKIFQSSDDSIFNRPDDPTRRPAIASAATSGAAYSTAEGDYSWFAVIDNAQRPWNPGADGAWGNATVDDNGDGVIDEPAEGGFPGTDDIALWKTSGGELWHVWAVVVHKRNFKLQVAAGEIPPERMCYCDFLNAPTPVNTATAQGQAVINNAGMGGGDCLLSISSSTASSPDWLNVKVNQWIMLSAFPNLSSSLTTPIKSQLCAVQWFRISAVGEIVAIPGSGSTPAGWQRSVTLAGPDWNPYKFFDALGVPPTTGFSGADFQTAYATIVDGACGVFEATIEQGQ